MRILVIDDNVDCAYMLKALIELCGHEVETAHTSEEGLRRAREWQPELIFLDIAMPTTDGYHLAAQLRAEAVLGPTKIVAVSGYKPDRTQCEAAGIDDYLMKPPSLKQLTEFFDCDRLKAA
jgi:CheY-like chemotaxis protein